MKCLNMSGFIIDFNSALKSTRVIACIDFERLFQILEIKGKKEAKNLVP